MRIEWSVGGICPADRALARSVVFPAAEVDAHVATCEGCSRKRAELETIATLLERVGDAWPSVSARGETRRALPKPALSLAAALAMAVALGLWTAFLSPIGDHQPSPRGRGAAAIEAQAQLGERADEVLLSWVPIPEAVRYRVTIWSTTGSPIHDELYPSAEMMVPLRVVLTPAADVLWLVRAFDESGEIATSGLIRTELR